MKKIESKIGKCEYHLCGKRTKVLLCRYCGRYFCKQHIKPKMVLNLHQVFTAKEPMRSWLEKDYRSEYGHPDMVYSQIAWDRLKSREKEESDKYWEALDRVNKEAKIERGIEKEEFSGHEQIQSTNNQVKYIEKRRPFLSLRQLWHKLSFSPQRFIKYAIIFTIILILLNLFLTGKFNLIDIILRSLGFSFIVYIFSLINRKTRYKIPWKWIILAILIIIFAHVYSTHDFSSLKLFDKLIGIENFTDKNMLPIFNYFQNLNQTTISNIISNVSSGIQNSILPQPIDSKWVNNFMSDVNTERIKNGLQPLKEAPELDAIAYSRFNTMITHPEISHYGAGTYNVGEVVFYPSGFTPQDYVTNIQHTAPLHWQLLVDPMFSYYGYYVGSGQTVQIIGSCPATEIPGPNINVVDFFQKQGCQIEMATTTWLVIEMT